MSDITDMQRLLVRAITALEVQVDNARHEMRMAREQRDATLGTYAEAEKRWKTIIAARDREQALYVQANHDFRDALTEARRVLREVEWGDSGYCPLCGFSGNHSPVCALAAVLAQEEAK